MRGILMAADFGKGGFCVLKITVAKFFCPLSLRFVPA
jgi:hypothetical protein